MSDRAYDDHEVIRFPIEGAFDVETARDDEVLEQIMNRLVHPSQAKGKSREELANIILELGGTKSPDGLSETMKKTRERVVDIRFGTAGLSNSDYDALLDPRDEQYDEGFAALYHALMSTRANAGELETERSALNVLMELRVAAVKKLGLYNPDDWIRVAKLLTRDLD